MNGLPAIPEKKWSGSRLKKDAMCGLLGQKHTGAEPQREAKRKAYAGGRATVDRFLLQTLNLAFHLLILIVEALATSHQVEETERALISFR